MRTRNTLSVLLLILWIGLLINNFMDLMEYLRQFGLEAFKLESFIFNLAFFIITIFMCIFLFTGRYKLFAIFFGIYTIAEALYSGINASRVSVGIDFKSLIETGDYKVMLYIITGFYLDFLTMAAYAVTLVIAIIMCLIGNRARYKMSYVTMNIGYAIAIVRALTIIFWFMNRTDGFELMEIIFELLSAVFFSIIYISVPRDLPYFFD